MTVAYPISMTNSKQNSILLSLNENVSLNLDFSIINGSLLSLKRNNITDMVMDAFQINKRLSGSIVSGMLKKNQLNMVLERVENDVIILKAEQE